MRLKKYFCLALYYGFAKFLPVSSNALTAWTKRLRRAICRPIFEFCGDNVNIEHGANFGMGGVLV